MAHTRGSTTVGSARVRSIPQHTQLQHDALEGADCVQVFGDKISSLVIHRPGLTKALDYPRDGGTLYVHKAP